MSASIFRVRFVVVSAVAAVVVALHGCRPEVGPNRQTLLLALRQEMLTQTEFVKVHAAEGLLEQGDRETVRQEFQRHVDNAAMPYAIGVWRVMARAADEAAQRESYVQRIRDVAFQEDAKFRLHAIESLAKLGAYRAEDRASLEHYLATADDASVAFARWLLAMSGQADDRRSLEALLSSPDATARLRTAFALSRMPDVDKSAAASLAAAVESEPLDSPARVYVLSAAIRHTDVLASTAAKLSLRLYLQHGKPNEELEAALALGSYGDRSDLQRLLKSLPAAEPDARIGAAIGALRLLDRQAVVSKE